MTISNEAVEAAAIANNEANYELAWTALPEWAKEQQRKDARRHLEAHGTYTMAGHLMDEGRRCTAMSKQSQDRCKRAAITGEDGE